jgi:hypothetical protein
MLRRQVLGGLAGAFLGAWGAFLGAWGARAAAPGTTVYSAKGLKADPPGGNAGEIERRANAARARALAAFPYERVETQGRDAFATWRALKAQGRGVPVVIGGDDDLARVAEWLALGRKQHRPDAILAAAAKLSFPQDLAALRKAEAEAERARTLKQYREHPDEPGVMITETDANGGQRTLSRAETWQRLLAPPQEIPLGDWPDGPDASSGLAVANDLSTGKPLGKVHIVLLPANDWTEAPAWLSWGGWNDCPAPEFHVAALRSWRERYGVELVGMSHEMLNLTAASRPQTRDEALALAREQYLYAPDVVEQGTQALRPLAYDLMSGDWWLFWWD